jgi:dienelactone hydrolase
VPGPRLPLRLARLGCEVVVPVLIDRGSAFSGSEALNLHTDLTHREWLYRMTFTLGRHVIGYELQKVYALVDWMEEKGRADGAPIAVAGYGEGGLLAFYAAATDTRIATALVSGYLRNRDRVWEEPLYRNVFGLLREFGDAEIASLIAPRLLVAEYSVYPHTPGNHAPRPGVRAVAAPGVLSQPEVQEVVGEVQRARALAGAPFAESLRFVAGAENSACPYFSDKAVESWLAGLRIATIPVGELAPPVRTGTPLPDVAERQRRQVREIQHDAQRLLPVCEQERATRFWKKLALHSATAFKASTVAFRAEFVNEVIGRFPDPLLPLRAYSRLLSENEAFRVYDVMLDVWPDVFAWGYLTVPKNIGLGEKRPVVVCQHGLEGLPTRCTTEDRNSRDYQGYKGVASVLARQGFVTFAPHNPYRGGDTFRMLQRKLNPLGKTLFSVINSQHTRILEWLGTQPFVDPARIAFYGLSYGGKSAMRIPAALDGYCLSICSGDFNDWVRKVISDDFEGSYLFTGEWEISEWNLGRTFSYAEMAALIAPRPFMVERGRDDGCGLDEWIAWEYAKVDRLYDRLGLDNRTDIEYFNGPHAINGKGTYEFLYRHLSWPPGAPAPK